MSSSNQARFLYDSMIRESVGDAVMETIQSKVANVLVIYSGGTIGMKSTFEHGYIPIPGYLTNTLTNMVSFNDRKSRESSLTETPGQTDELLSKKFNLVNIPVAETQTAQAHPSQESSTNSEETFIVNGTKCIKKKLACLISPPSIFGKRIRYSIVEYEQLLDSSDMSMSDWIKIATDIEVNYKLFDAFIVLHGTDTMAYTASALSFMLEDLGKPVILTGSQIPLSELRNDAVDNLIGAMTIAAHYVIPEVCLYFNHKLYRGNRASKVDAVEFSAFDSPNMRPLVSVGVQIDVNWSNVLRPSSIATFRVQKTMSSEVACLKLFPGISDATIHAALAAPVKGVVFETFGSGNAPKNRPTLLNYFKEASERGVVIVNCTQCRKGMVNAMYATGKALLEVGVVPGSDMTPEVFYLKINSQQCALTKLCYLLSKDYTPDECRTLMGKSLRGELSNPLKQARFTYNPPVLNKISLIMSLLKQGLTNFERLPESSQAMPTTTTPVSPTVIGFCENELEGVDKLFSPLLFAQAIVNRDSELLTQALEHFSMFVNVCDFDGRTALHLACVEGQVDYAEQLLKAGANVHLRDRFGNSPLRDAIRSKSKTLIRLLKVTGAHFSQDEEEHVLIEASISAKNGDLAFIKLCTLAGVEFRSCLNGDTVLHSAVRGNQQHIVQWLVAPQDEVDGQLQQLHLEELKLNKQNEGVPNKMSLVGVDEKNDDGFTAIDLAFARGYTEIINILSR